MTKINIRSLFLMLFFISGIIFITCDGGKNNSNNNNLLCPIPNEQSEKFNMADIPVFSFDSVTNDYFVTPWNYNKSWNATRKYPLVVYLHGSGASNAPKSHPYIGGYDETNIYHPTEMALNFLKSHPSFVYLPYTSNATTIMTKMEELITNNRIDRNRIYLIGYSMGGSGSYALARSYYSTYGRLFAGIIRLSGMYEYSLAVSGDNTIYHKTSVWLHIGVDDTYDTRVVPARNSYEQLKTNNQPATEIETSLYIDSPTDGDKYGTTVSLIKNNMAIAKKTEYLDTGHGILLFPFQDSCPINWLFYQSLTKR